VVSVRRKKKDRAKRRLVTRPNVMLAESLPQSSGKVTGYGYGGCNRGLPEGTWIKTCVMDLSEFGYNFIECKCVKKRLKT
jgi:hypothetical protein